MLLIKQYGRFAFWIAIERWMLQRWGCSQRKAWIYEMISFGSVGICYQAPKRFWLFSQRCCFVQWSAKEKASLWWRFVKMHLSTWLRTYKQFLGTDPTTMRWSWKLKPSTSTLKWKKPNMTRNSRRMLNTVLSCKVQLDRSVETHQVHQGNQQLPQEQED